MIPKIGSISCLDLSVSCTSGSSKSVSAFRMKSWVVSPPSSSISVSSNSQTVAVGCWHKIIKINSNQILLLNLQERVN